MCSVACFIRDSAGALKLHTAAPVQYFRPEIVGFVCGSFLLALLTREYKSTAGSSPMVRFILGAAMMIGAHAQYRADIEQSKIEIEQSVELAF